MKKADRILFHELDCLHSKDAEFYFRGESMNFARQKEGFSLPLGTSFPCSLDRDEAWRKNERELYHEALRLNIVSFDEDKTMVERVARMQHYQLPTRFCDMTSDVLTATQFACGTGDVNIGNRDNGHDGYIRVIKVKRERMKSFTSDIITAIAHLPLVRWNNVNPSKENGLDYLRYEVTNSRPGFSMEVAESTGSDRLRSAKEQLREEIQHVWAFKPILNTPRIRSQSGIFLVFGCRDGKQPLNPSFSTADYDKPDAPSFGIAQVAVIQIDGSCKKRIRDELRYFGMPTEGLYPDLSNVCMEISQRIRKL
ncbi:MAG: FRG domain-containing protein [Kiritimatiellia bacterium]